MHDLICDVISYVPEPMICVTWTSIEKIVCASELHSFLSRTDVTASAEIIDT